MLIHPASPYAISKTGTDLVGRFHAEAYGQKVLITRMFTHTGPRRGDVFAESTFAKHIGGTFSCTVEDMLSHLISISTCRDSIRIETEPARLRPLDADLQVPDTVKFRAHTGWKPEISFEKTMQDLLDYWRGRVIAGKVFLTR